MTSLPSPAPRKAAFVVSLLFAFAVTMTSFFAAAHAAAQSASTQQDQRLVFQINEDNSKKWHEVLVNIRNIQAADKDINIAVVLIGPGLGMIKFDALTANGVSDAIAAGVEFVACGNSMQAQHVDADDLVAGVVSAPSGYVELMQRQLQGWAYLRP
ncbi:DsrE family protein [bacterium]|nr:DsrE family protein [bacterium]